MKHAQSHISLTVFVLFLAAVGRAAEPVAWDTWSDTWTATDGLGRVLPSAHECGPPRSGRCVAMFYFLWMQPHIGQIHDITQILAANPQNPQWGPVHAFHWWGQPCWGYYRSDDSAVIRKHVQMLSDAGVDALFLDVTNALTYDATVQALCRVLDEHRRTGQKTPQIAFLAHSHCVKTVQHLYDTFYAKNQFPALWFRWRGKPLVLADLAGHSPAVQQFFTIRESWAWTKGQKWFGDGRDKWPWIDHHPQQPGWHDDPKKPEQIAVCVAQHPVSNIGRSFHNGAEPPPDKRPTEQGLCFAEQWQRALQVDPELVLVTGWNEWIAQRFIAKHPQPFLGGKTPVGGTFFVDQYNQEFSRDIEPMRGGHEDNYYYQLVANVRRYKGARALPAVRARPIQIDGRFDDWRAVEPEYRDTLGDPVRRDHPGCGKDNRYVDATGRNDIVAAKVSGDENNVYFYARTREPLSPASDPNWMLLYIDADANPSTGWLGYDFVVNRSGVTAQNTVMERNAGNKYAWNTPRTIAYRAAGNELELSIPRADLGLARLPATIHFKWADNIPQTGQAADFTLHGDAAPNDRFGYTARLETPAP